MKNAYSCLQWSEDRRWCLLLSSHGVPLDDSCASVIETSIRKEFQVRPTNLNEQETQLYTVSRGVKRKETTDLMNETVTLRHDSYVLVDIQVNGRRITTTGTGTSKRHMYL